MEGTLVTCRIRLVVDLIIVDVLFCVFAERRPYRLGVPSSHTEPRARLRVRYRGQRWPGQSALCERRPVHSGVRRPEVRSCRGKANVSCPRSMSPGPASEITGRNVAFSCVARTG